MYVPCMYMHIGVEVINAKAILSPKKYDNALIYPEEDDNWVTWELPDDKKSIKYKVSLKVG